MTPDERDSDDKVLVYRLVELEHKVDRLEGDVRRGEERTDAAVRSFSERVDARFSELTTLMGKLAYVPRGEHLVEHRALEERMASLIAAATSQAVAADRHSWWAIGLIVSLVIAVIVTATVSQAF